MQSDERRGSGNLKGYSYKTGAFGESKAPFLYLKSGIHLKNLKLT